MASYFISHSSKHKPFCESLLVELQAGGHAGWLDAFDIHPGAAIPGAIIDGIYRSDYFVLVVTPEIHTSDWVAWELNVATYREIQTLRRTFIIPGTRVPCGPVQMVAHKNHIDMQGSPKDVAQLLTAASKSTPSTVPSLPVDAYAVIAEIIPLSGSAFTTRKLEDAFWKVTTPTSQGCFFPAALRGHWLSVDNDRVVIGLKETGRTTTTLLNTDGAIRIAEINFSGAISPVVEGSLLIRKIAKLLKLARDFATHFGIAEKMTIAIKLAGTDREFQLAYNPSDMSRVAFGTFRSQFSQPSGQPLAASVQVSKDEVASADQVAAVVDELQADLFHPLRVRPDPAVGGGEFSIRYSTQSVFRYSTQALQDIWS